jgi:hypothetical protein
MNDEEFEIYYGDPETLEDSHSESFEDAGECAVMKSDSEEFERAVLRYSKVKKVSFEASTMLMLNNSDLLKEWGVR